ncbi:MAG: DHHA1 domain-containing protein [Candidatus Acidiferrum sp.]|jgi:alanyl-tRNA synthetase
MTTHRIYYDDAFEREFDARVVHCDLLPPDLNSGITSQALGLILDRTAFYPSSGGQPHDLGKIGDANVLDVRDEGDDIIHVVDRRPETPDVLACINWTRRFDHMQQHTGQHLLSAMFQERFGRPTVSFHLGADVSSIDLRGPEPTDEVLEGAERSANQVIFEDRPVTVRYGTAEDLAKLGVRKEVERKGILRAIEIERVDLQPCGGTHVRSTGQIGTLLVRRCTKMRQDWRVEFVCGVRAERAARQDFLRIRAAAEKLSCAPEEVVVSAERTLSERDSNFKNAKAALQLLADAEAGLAIPATPASTNGLRIISRVLVGIPAEFLALFATALAKFEKTIALLARAEDGNIIFAQHASSGMDMNALLRLTLEKVGGKGGGPRDFARGRLEDAGKAEAALAVAREALGV